MHDDELLESTIADGPSSAFVDELWDRLDAAWDSRDTSERTHPPPVAIDVVVLDDKEDPMGRNRFGMILASVAAVAAVVAIGFVVISDDDDPDTATDVADTTGDADESTEPDTTTPDDATDRTEVESQDDDEPSTTEAPEAADDPPPESDWQINITYIDVGALGTVAATEDRAWVVDSSGQSLSTIDLATNTVVASSGAPEGAQSAWFAADSVWLAANDTIVRLDPDTLLPLATIDVGGTVVWLEGDAEAVWLGNFLGSEAIRIDPATNEIVARVPLGQAAGAIKANVHGVWIRGLDGTVYRIDPATNEIVAQIPTATPGFSMMAGPDAVWAPGADSNEVYRIDPATNSVTAVIDVGEAAAAPVQLLGVHYGDGTPWVRFARCETEQREVCEDHAVVRIDPATDEVVALADLRSGWQPGGVAAAPDAMWTASTDAIARLDWE